MKNSVLQLIKCDNLDIMVPTKSKYFFIILFPISTMKVFLLQAIIPKSQVSISTNCGIVPIITYSVKTWFLENLSVVYLI